LLAITVRKLLTTARLHHVRMVACVMIASRRMTANAQMGSLGTTAKAIQTTACLHHARTVALVRMGSADTTVIAQMASLAMVARMRILA
jgi:hypothetical protein